jgi:alpha-beta hydrolase superfamily lysophospholipase
MVAQGGAGRLSAVVLFGYVLDPDTKIVDSTNPVKPLMEKNTAEAAASDFVTPSVTPRAVVKAYVEQALKADPIRVDLKNDSDFNGIKPGRIVVPTLVMYGEHDAINDVEAGKFFAALGAPDKTLVVLPGGDHAALVEDTHDLWVATVVNFLTRPPARRF